MLNLFNSIFNNTTASADPFQLLLELLVNLVLGLALYLTTNIEPYTREFTISLDFASASWPWLFFYQWEFGHLTAVREPLVWSVLFSNEWITRTDRHILAMIIGLASCGTGYLFLAILLHFILGVWFL